MDYDLYRHIQQIIFDIPKCPDGHDVACPSCIASAIAKHLDLWECPCEI